MKKLLLSISALLVTVTPALADVADDLRECDRHYEDGNLKKAAAACDTAIRKYPGQVPAEAYAKRAAIFVQLGDLEGGLAFVRDRAKKQFPDDAAILAQEAVILWGLGKKGDAITVAEKSANADAGQWPAQFLIGEFYAARDPEKTAVAYEAYLQHRPSDREDKDVLPLARVGFAYLALASTAVGDGRGDDARQAYAKAEGHFATLKRKHAKRPHATVNANNGLCGAYTGLGKYDQAITICEAITDNPKLVDSNGSVWFNLGRAYLAKKQAGRARAAATEYTKLRPKEAKGYILIGDAYFQERDYQRALENYLRAEQLLRTSEQTRASRLAIQMGKTYRRLPFNGSGQNPNLLLAIEKLEAGLEANPNDADLAIELGAAYLAARDDAGALAKADRLINAKDFKKKPERQRAELLAISGKALYNQGKVKDARARLETAHELRPRDVKIKKALVISIQYQAYAAFADKKDHKTAAALLDQAAEVDPSVPALHLDRAVLAIDQGDCAGAQKHLNKLEGAQGYSLIHERLLARTYLCLDKPNPKKAAEHYAIADKEAKRAQANLIQAEIYTEWAPLLPAGDDTVSKLQDAVQFSAQAPGIHAAAKRNLAVALFRRGWILLKDGKASAAAADFERASREPALLKGTEPLAFDFSYALALLDKGDTGEAAKLFKSLAAKGNASSYLKPPYNKVGNTFFAAYASYRGGTVEKRRQAAAEFESLATGASGTFQQKVRDLLASSYEYVAYDAWRNGKESAAKKALTSASKYAKGDLENRIKCNRAALDLTAKQIDVLEGLGSSPPEALLNLGILYDRAGKPKEAYEAWTRAKAKGVDHKDLKKWIDAKQRIYGFN